MSRTSKKLYLLILTALLTVGSTATADEYFEDWNYEDEYSEDWYDDDYEDDFTFGQWYYISTDYDPGIALHPIPEKNSETLIRIPYLHTFFVDEIDGNYGYTYYDGYEGWINIGEHAEPITLPSELDDCYTENEWYRISTKYDPGIALHPIPLKESETLIRVPYGTDLYIEYISGNYGYTNYDGFQGWINVGEHAKWLGDAENDFYYEEDEVYYDNADCYYDHNYDSEYILPESSSRYLSYDEISYLSAQELCYARNEIYARHGREFNSTELQSYFNSTSWYEGIYSPDTFKESSLNVYEQKNVILLLEREKEICPGGYILGQSKPLSISSSTNYSAEDASLALNEYCTRFASSEYPSYVSDEYQEGNNYILWYRWYTGFHGKYTADLVSGEMYESGPYVGNIPHNTLPFSTEYIGNIDEYL